MCSAAEKRRIPYQREVLDGGSPMPGHPDVPLRRTGGLPVHPCRYVHSPSEMVDYEDVRILLN